MDKPKIGAEIPPVTVVQLAEALAEHRTYCDAEFEDTYGCTRAQGHRGPHVAGFGPDAIVAVWED